VKPKASFAAFAFCAIVIAALQTGCVQAPLASETTNVINPRCDQTGSNLPRRECRPEVKTSEPNK
jgi:hypothetical protein